MRRGTLAAILVGVALVACGSSGSSDDPNAPGGPGATNGPTDPNQQAQPPTPDQQVQQILDARKVDYGEAARTAKLKLNDELPTLDEINSIANAADVNAKKAAYEKLVDTWIAAPKFAVTMVKYWKDTFKTAQTGAVTAPKPNMDEAALFAAQVTVEGRSFSEILTATTNTCPTFDPATGVFTAASCTTNPTVGILTDPGILAQYYANMAFRRIRFLQETFACQKFPAEIRKDPTPLGNGTYTNPFDFNQLMGKQNNPQARIDFQDTSAVICANCHGHLNRMAPLFVNYDMNGMMQATPQVEVPIPGTPKVDPAKDYLVAGAQPQYAWRFNVPVTDIASLGKAIADDKAAQTCAVNRVWNYAMSRGDIVNDLATVPEDVTAPIVTDFAANGQKLKETIRAVFKADDFVKF
jgi:hypothetical protein